MNICRITSSFVRRSVLQSKPLSVIPRRSWAQNGIFIATPPRVKVGFFEKIGHGLFMYAVWFTPLFYMISQVKVWRRQYVEN